MKFLTRYYKNPSPSVGEMVIGKVMKYTQYGINIYLPEYKLTAFLNFKDAAGSRWLNRIKQQVKINKTEFYF